MGKCNRKNTTDERNEWLFGGNKRAPRSAKPTRMVTPLATRQQRDAELDRKTTRNSILKEQIKELPEHFNSNLLVHEQSIQIAHR